MMLICFVSDTVLSLGDAKIKYIACLNGAHSIAEEAPKKQIIVME